MTDGLRRLAVGCTVSGPSAPRRPEQTQSGAGRTCTGGTIAVLSAILRRCPEQHVAIVRDYAAALTARIDHHPAAMATSGSAA